MREAGWDVSGEVSASEGTQGMKGPADVLKRSKTELLKTVLGDSRVGGSSFQVTQSGLSHGMVVALMN